MSNWRDVILKKFKNQSSSFLLVYDFDFLLNEEVILNDLVESGYHVLRYEDSITFRYIYEQKIRGREKDIKLIVFANEDIFFPYEFEKKALKIQMDIQTIFPKFSANIIRNMNRDDFDELYRLHLAYHGTTSEQDTLAFIIKNFYKIPYEIIDGEVGLYKILLSIHYQKQDTPDVVRQFLYDKWYQVNAFKNMPLKNLIGSSSFFYQYLEDKWKSLVMKVSSFENGQVNDSFSIEYSSPLADGDVRRMMNDLFLDGTLQKVKGIDASNYPEWMKPGIEAKEPGEDVEKKLDYLYEEIISKLVNVKRYKDWINIMEYLAEFKHSSISIGKKQDELMDKVNQSFTSWMMKHYHSLTSLPPYPKPKLVHHIAHVINNDKN